MTASPFKHQWEEVWVASCSADYNGVWSIMTKWNDKLNAVEIIICVCKGIIMWVVRNSFPVEQSVESKDRCDMHVYGLNLKIKMV